MMTRVTCCCWKRAFARAGVFEVLTWWGEHTQSRKLPIIVMSGSNQESDIARAMALGAAAYQVKPSDFDYLVAVAREVRARWLVRPGMVC